jgi:hypothetical protein
VKQVLTEVCHVAFSKASPLELDNPDQLLKQPIAEWADAILEVGRAFLEPSDQRAKKDLKPPEDSWLPAVDVRAFVLKGLENLSLMREEN